jgi:hypothetical protein
MHVGMYVGACFCLRLSMPFVVLVLSSLFVCLCHLRPVSLEFCPLFSFVLVPSETSSFVPCPCPLSLPIVSFLHLYIPGMSSSCRGLAFLLTYASILCMVKADNLYGRQLRVCLTLTLTLTVFLFVI